MKYLAYGLFATGFIAVSAAALGDFWDLNFDKAFGLTVFGFICGSSATALLHFWDEE